MHGCAKQTAESARKGGLTERAALVTALGVTAPSQRPHLRPSHAQGATLFVSLQPLPIRERFGAPGLLLTDVLSVTLEGQVTDMAGTGGMPPLCVTVLPITVLPAPMSIPRAPMLVT